MGENEDDQRDTEQLSEQPRNYRENAERTTDGRVDIEGGERSDLSERVKDGEISIDDVPGGYVPRSVRTKVKEASESAGETKADDE